MFSNAKKAVVQEELSNSSNIIGQGTNFEGHLNTAGNIRVEGKVVGSIQTKAKIVLSNTSVVEGNIIAKTAEIGGEVQGAIMVSGLLTLKPTATIKGDIITSKLVFEEGAKFNGKCSMDSSLKVTEVMQPTAMVHKENSSPIGPVLQQVMLSKNGGKGPQ